MTVEELAAILNKMIEDGKADYEVTTYDWDVNNYYIGNDYIQLTN